MVILPECVADRAAIDALHVVAFSTAGEAALVSALRASGELVTSLVAEIDGAVVGHVAFSPVTLDPVTQQPVAQQPVTPGRASGLGPIAVAPAFRRSGIAEALVVAGLAARRSAGDDLVVVLGDPAYYARFGFQPAASFGLRDEYGGGDAFQALELRQGGAPSGGGAIRYAAPFALVAEEPAGDAPREHLALILAVAENGALGRAGGLPWDLPDDRAHFDRTTRGHTVILGRRTWDETGVALPGRRTIVVSSRDLVLEGATVVPSLDAALRLARVTDPMPFVIGGRRLFEEAQSRATRVYLTEVAGAPEADVFVHLDRRGLDEVASWRGRQGERYVVLERTGGEPPTAAVDAGAAAPRAPV